MMEYDRAYASEWLRKEELAVGLGKLLEEKELLASFGMIWGDLFSELDRGEAVLHARERILTSISRWRGREEIVHLVCPELWDDDRFCQGQNPSRELLSFLLGVVKGEVNPFHSHSFSSSCPSEPSPSLSSSLPVFSLSTPNNSSMDSSSSFFSSSFDSSLPPSPSFSEDLYDAFHYLFHHFGPNTVFPGLFDEPMCESKKKRLFDKILLCRRSIWCLEFVQEIIALFCRKICDEDNKKKKDTFVEAFARYSEQLKICAGCGVESTETKRCGRCRKIWYCSKSCQVNDWPNHKRVCVPAARKK